MQLYVNTACIVIRLHKSFHLMKIYLLVLGLLISFPQLDLFSQVFLDEGFEGGSRPEGWTEEYVFGEVNWRYRNGGYNPSDPNLDNPITPTGR